MNITIDTETVDYLKNTISYYEHHKVDKLVESHKGFVVDDFTNLLDKLKEILGE